MEEKQNDDFTAEAELEGGGYAYWWVCSECHTMIKQGADICPGCKRRIRWT